MGDDDEESFGEVFMRRMEKATRYGVPHQGDREKARRVRQMMFVDLKRRNKASKILGPELSHWLRAVSDVPDVLSTSEKYVVQSYGTGMVLTDREVAE